MDAFAVGPSGSKPGEVRLLPRRPPPVENKLWCSLEELYNGSTRKMKITRTVVDISGQPKSVEELLTIHVEAGWKKDTRITFPGKGNVLQAGLVPADLVFVVDEKPHDTFTRKGRDLIMTKKISLAAALTGCSFEIGMLDGRTLSVNIPEVVHLGFEKVVPRKGMPVAIDPERRGNLRIKFDVEFPARLSGVQRNGLKTVLGGVRDRRGSR